MKFGIIDFMMASLQVAFIVMKLCGAISWSWWLVLLPILLVVVINVLVYLLLVCIKVYKYQILKQYYFEVLMTQRDVLEAKLDLIETKQKQLASVVQIYRSLGGGWK